MPAIGRARHPPVRRGAPPRGAGETPPGRTGSTAARRAHQPPGCRIRPMAGATPGQIPGCRPGRHPRPIFPRPRGRLDLRSRPRQTVPLRGQLLHLPGEESRTPRGRRPERPQATKTPEAGAGMGAVRGEGPSGQVQGPPGPLRRNGRRGGEIPQAGLRRNPNPHPAAPGRPGGGSPQP